MVTNAPLLGEPLAVELMNTIWADRAGVHDSLDDADGALAWLASISPRAELLDTSDLDDLSPAEATRVVDSVRKLRDALRRVAADATADERAAAQSPIRNTRTAVEIINHASASAHVWESLELAEDGALTGAFSTAGNRPAAVVAAIAGEAVGLVTGTERTRLRACQAPGCVLYFVKQHPRREWCSAACGNRARVARHYERHGGGRPGPA